MIRSDQHQIWPGQTIKKQKDLYPSASFWSVLTILAKNLKKPLKPAKIARLMLFPVLAKKKLKN